MPREEAVAVLVPADAGPGAESFGDCALVADDRGHQLKQRREVDWAVRVGEGERLLGREREALEALS